MHSSTHNDYDFFYNGDYSGDITILDENGSKTVTAFENLVTTALHDVIGLPRVQAIRGFVADAAVNEAIALLEQMETDDVLANPWLGSILTEMTSKGKN